jgi:diguanylate cyclase (GGDEF)-like protein
VLGEEVYAKNLPYLDAVLEGEEQLFDRTLVDTSGRARHTQASYVPDVVAGEVVGFFVLVTEVTVRVEAERAVARAASHYRALARSLPGAFVLLFDGDLRYLVADGQGLDAFGLRAASMEGRTVGEVLPERSEELEPRYRDALAGAESAWDRSVGGRVFHLTAGPVRDEGGEVIAGMVIGVDVTGERRLTAIQAALHRLTRATARRTPAVEVIEDLGATLVELFGAGYVGVVRFDGDTITVVSTTPALPNGVGPTVPHDGRSATSRVLASGEAHLVDIGAEDAGHLGQMHAVGVRSAAAVPITVAGRLWGALAVGLPEARSELDDALEEILADFADLVALAVSNSDAWAELERRSTTDPLTGLANRRTLEERLAGEIDRARRSDAPVSVAILDLDHFKGINDRHGHAIGDAVLAQAARSLADACRSHELVARLGGEEFAVLLPAASADAAFAATERLRAAVAAAYPRGLRVSASAGCASARGREVDPTELMRRADHALYRAKHAGRDRTISGDVPRSAAGATGAG